MELDFRTVYPLSNFARVAASIGLAACPGGTIDMVADDESRILNKVLALNTSLGRSIIVALTNELLLLACITGRDWIL